MTAYNETDLRNAQVQELAHEAFTARYIDEASYGRILQGHPVHLYTPNYFIRVGLTLLTLVCTLFSAGLFALFFHVSGEGSFITSAVILAICCYGFLEFMVKTKNYYNAGIDNALSVFAFLFITGAFCISTYPHKEIIVCFVALLAAAWLCIRFADAFMGLIAYLALLALTYYTYSSIGGFFRETVFLPLMLLSVLFYIIAGRCITANRFAQYRPVLQSLKAASLVSFYAAGNYYVLMLLITHEFDTTFVRHNVWTWFFWIFTLVMPVVYIIAGIQKKDILWIRTGLCLVAAGVFTFRNYYHLLDTEEIMILAGLVLTGVSYALIRYLAIPHRGFTAAHTGVQSKAMQQAEALIIAQSLGKPAAAPESGGVHFGGGSGGGGGDRKSVV